MFQFKFIKYTQPGWQFNIELKTRLPVATAYYHPIYQPEKPSSVTEDLSYETETARWTDIGFRLWQSGFLALCNEENRRKILSASPPSVKDEYRFVAKYWGTFFVFYAFICRVITLNNLIQEIRAFLHALTIRRVNIHTDLTNIKEYNNHISPLVSQAPFVSLIIPTLNRYEYLKDALEDLEKQSL